MPFEDLVKKPAPVDLGDYKPSYSAVAVIFQTYLRGMSQANMPNSLRDPEAWEAKAIEHKQQLELELTQIGLAKHIAFDH